MINRDRLAQTFTELVEIDSVSKEEADVARYIRKYLEDMGVETFMDGAGEEIGGNSGNLFARFDGGADVPPILLSAHMDTVEPGRGIRAEFKDGVFRSRGETILGADDKSALAAILECLQVIRENRLPCGPVEIVLTVSEEIGLVGAKHLDYKNITAEFGYVIDAMDPYGIITRAPSVNRFEIRIHGKEAHAGASPEDGINAIHIAGKALAKLRLGRIDADTTCNIGVIEGGVATNIIPNYVMLKGEARSHNADTLERITDEILSAFRETAEAHRPAPDSPLPRVDIDLDNDFAGTDIAEDHPVVTLAKRAGENMGKEMYVKSTGGGSDANVFAGKGIIAGVLGTGMKDMHSVQESVSLEDLEWSTALLVEILRLHAGKGKS